MLKDELSRTTECITPSTTHIVMFHKQRKHSRSATTNSRSGVQTGFAMGEAVTHGGFEVVDFAGQVVQPPAQLLVRVARAS